MHWYIPIRKNTCQLMHYNLYKCMLTDPFIVSTSLLTLCFVMYYVFIIIIHNTNSCVDLNHFYALQVIWCAIAVIIHGQSMVLSSFFVRLNSLWPIQAKIWLQCNHFVRKYIYISACKACMYIYQFLIYNNSIQAS